MHEEHKAEDTDKKKEDGCVDCQCMTGEKDRAEATEGECCGGGCCAEEDGKL